MFYMFISHFVYKSRDFLFIFIFLQRSFLETAFQPMPILNKNIHHAAPRLQALSQTFRFRSGQCTAQEDDQN